MFYGEYAHTLDRKGRLILPARFRDALKRQGGATRCYLTRGLDGCLFLFTEDEWQAQEARFRNASFTKAEARRFNRLYFSGAVDLELDRQGRILVPKHLQDYAGIKQAVVVVGVSNRAEIWAKDRWEQFYEQTRPAFEEIAERFVE